MTVRLRPHHLLCLTTYVGLGYSPAFVENYDRIVARLGAGEQVALVSGPDDICAPLLSEADPHCHRASVGERDRLAGESVMPLLHRDERGLRLTGKAMDELRTAFRGGSIRAACAGCDWVSLCDAVAKHGFSGTRLG